MPSLSRSFGKYLYDQLKTASAAPLLLVAQTGRLSWYGSYLCHNQNTHARAHATVPSTFCSERVLIRLMKLHVDIIHALSLKMIWILLVCIVAWN